MADMAPQLAPVCVEHLQVQIRDTFVHLAHYELSQGPQAGGPPRRPLCIFVPGNPGLLGVYHDFLLQLLQRLAAASQRAAPAIVAISHNNFDHPDCATYKTKQRLCLDDSQLTEVERQLADRHRGQPCHMELQVLFKQVILKKVLKLDPARDKLMFVGHSIGAYVILRLLQDRWLARAHLGSVLIHPVFENVAKSQKGSYYDKVFAYKLDHAFTLVVALVSRLVPRPAKLALARWVCNRRGPAEALSDTVVESMAQLAAPSSFRALIDMAKSELALIKDINVDAALKPFADKLKLIYATNDHWVNPDNRKQLRHLLPQLHIEELDNLHAFVMEPETVINYAAKVGRFLDEYMAEDGQTNNE